MPITPKVKQEQNEFLHIEKSILNDDAHHKPLQVIKLSSSDSDSSDGSMSRKRHRVSNLFDEISIKKQPIEVVLPLGFLDPLPSEDISSVPPILPVVDHVKSDASVCMKGYKQFWKAGDYEGDYGRNWGTISGGIDHVRVHPKFLHSNATSHKWSLGAFAELLDNALDEVYNGATYVNIDMIGNKKDNTRMLMIEDDGGGMDPDKMRQCMSLGYSAKSKSANTIGQYGNGFKTSTMRLGADVIVFSRCCGQTKKKPTQSIGLLSYTFLRSTGKEDIVVPMLDYERVGSEWCKITRSSEVNWNNNLKTIVEWSPYSSEAELLKQFNRIKDHGTYILIYNLWEDDNGQLELDFDTSEYDIQIKGVNRDEKKIKMGEQFPNSKHFLTYRHSLRSYASILYLRIPPGFRIILRGKDVEHHNLVNDMMMAQEITYRPQHGANGVSKDLNMAAVVTVGFVKDAKSHFDVQGFNVYHKNRLIKPFWKLWNSSGSEGRGVIGLLEANFVEPAHDKQGFERTTVLARLESRLIQMQKTYWTTYCHNIGYAPRRNKKFLCKSTDKETSPANVPGKISSYSKKTPLSFKSGKQPLQKYGNGWSSPEPSMSKRIIQYTSSMGDGVCVDGDLRVRNLQLEENLNLRDSLKKKNEEVLSALHDLQSEKDRCKCIEQELRKTKQQIEGTGKEHENLIDVISEERERRDMEESKLKKELNTERDHLDGEVDILRKKLKEASSIIHDLLEKVRLLESETSS